MKKQSKKIITMIIAIMLLVVVPVTNVSAVPKKSGVDKTMSAKLEKQTKDDWVYKGKKKRYFDSLATKWSKGKISVKTMKKKLYGMKWSEPWFVTSNNETNPVMPYHIGSWGTVIVKFSTKTTSVNRLRSKCIMHGIVFNNYSKLIAKWNKRNRQYTIYYLGIDFQPY
ncbi:hypothetical protein [Clostridium oryzae]|uniref:Uncharacterized protein n=1 Tax=Clostridium oryzae TaxID=1450648 RepID=A0A1V4IJ90_9CLOT|nr:hypothetical protein [Clostridium oryzae]OPJ59775.1 hypothetical protein CLORY_31200 [Clostridium oryzae]